MRLGAFSTDKAHGDGLWRSTMAKRRLRGLVPPVVQIRRSEAPWCGEGGHSTDCEIPASSCYPQNFMPTDQIVHLLIAERDKLNRAIEALQGSVKRRGRPPKNQSAAVAPATAAPTRKRRRQSAAQRKAQAERMKAYWAAKRKKQAKGLVLLAERSQPLHVRHCLFQRCFEHLR